MCASVGSVLPVRSDRPLTTPDEFRFATDERLGPKEQQPQQQEDKPKPRKVHCRVCRPVLNQRRFTHAARLARPDEA